MALPIYAANCTDDDNDCRYARNMADIVRVLHAVNITPSAVMDQERKPTDQVQVGILRQ